MSPDQDPGRPQAWLRRARSNLARARQLAGTPDVLYEDLCFDAQQAAEKALKAVLVAKGVRVPRTHAIAELLTLAQMAHVSIPAHVRSATLLTPYAVEARYPGVWEEVTAGDYEQALHVAGQVLAWAEEQVSTK
ncbi:MAG: HEPN domain-containing protein [Betaproteobacteria bacterium]